MDVGALIERLGAAGFWTQPGVWAFFAILLSALAIEMLRKRIGQAARRRINAMSGRVQRAAKSAGAPARAAAERVQRVRRKIYDQAEEENVAAWFVLYRALAFGVFLLFFLAFLGLVIYAARAWIIGDETFVGDLQSLAEFGALIVGFLGALSIPLVMHRAAMQERQVRVAEDANVTDRIIRATELLGATKERDAIETLKIVSAGALDAATSEDVTPFDDDEPGADQEPILAEEFALAEARDDARVLYRQTAVTKIAENIEVRLGAIYTLERVAQKSRQDYWPIIQTILAYIRERRGAPRDFMAAWTAANPEPDEKSDPETWAAWRKARTLWIRGQVGEGGLRDAAKILRPADEDVRTAIGVLRRRNRRNLVDELGSDPEDRAPARDAGPYGVWRDAPRRPFELADTPLQGGDLREISWSKQSLAEARLDGADLTKARMRGADLRRASLVAASMEAVSMIEANVAGANFTGCDLRFARFTRAEGRRVRLECADALNANFDHGSFRRSVFVGARLRHASAIGADFADANLFFTDLRNMDFTGADFASADLRRADMRRSVLTNANLAKADLSGARLSYLKAPKLQARRARFVDAALFEADLTDADLQGGYAAGVVLAETTLRRADMRGLRLEHATLRAARLAGADMRGAALHGASLVGVILRDEQTGESAKLEQAQLETAFGDRAAADAVRDIGLSPPAHWRADRAFRGHADAREAWRSWREARGLFWPPRGDASDPVSSDGAASRSDEMSGG